MKRVVIGLSGGVDSSVSAFLLKEQGYEVVGITFKTLPTFDSTDARIISETLNIEFHEIDITKDFEETIINSFLNDYKNGLTPNPCVLCNKKIKFKYLEEARIKYNCDYIATGHYAKIENGNIYKSEDLNKDQTYFLSQIDRSLLDKILFPLEGISKDKVREIAQNNNLITAHKKDSYDVCFINDKFKDFMKEHLSTKKGDIVLIETNQKIGTHNGLSLYTIGQRKGLDIGGTQDRLFVVKKDMDKNILYVTEGENSKYLYSNKAIITNVNFLTSKILATCEARFRYRSKDEKVTVKYLNDNEVEVSYESAKAVTKGQTCTFYDGNHLLGGGTIKEVYYEE